MLFPSAVFCHGLALFLRYRASLERSRKLPPGPTPEPIIGNIRKWPTSYSWLYFTELGKKYGDVFHLSLLGTPFIVLNSAQAASDLLVKRAAIYSDRPRAVMLGEIMGFVKGVVITPYGDYWRAQRRLFHQHLSGTPIRQYYNRIEDETRAYVLRLHELRPKDLVEEFKLSGVRLILGVTYGHNIKSLEDEYAALSVEVNHVAEVITAPGAGFLVDVFPAIQYAPSWLPGMGWKRQGEYWAGLTRKMVDLPYEATKRDLAAGTAIRSVTANMIEDQISGIPADEEPQKWLSGMMYGAGVETTQSIVGRFLLAMLLYPQVQAKIQEELDSVVGLQRLPSVQDKEHLPYIDAVIKECYRWHIPTPLALPRRLMEDDEYEGYLLPKGSVIITNSWAISQDPDMYPNPDDFVPERYLPTDGSPVPLDPRIYVFGYGKRVCPGRHFAEIVLFMTIASALSTSNILKALDENGHETTPKAAFTGTMLSSSEPFPCRIEPRSESAMTMLAYSVS